MTFCPSNIIVFFNVIVFVKVNVFVNVFFNVICLVEIFFAHRVYGILIGQRYKKT